MTDAHALERHYRRLLGCYPAEHRRTYAEEMIGVLLASAPDGRRRPSIAETFDLIVGAARARARTLMATTPDRGWRDALAVSSLLAPLLLAVLLLGQNLGWMATLLWHSWIGSTGVLHPLWPALVVLIPVALALARLRWAAITAGAALLVWITIQAELGHRLQEPRFAAYLVLLAISVAAIATSEGPGHGLQLLTVKGILVGLPWLATIAYAAGIIPTHYPVPLVIAKIGIAAVAIAGLPALVTASGRRVLALLVVIPGSAFVVSLLTFASVSLYSMSFGASQLALYLPPLLLAVLTVALIRRSRRQIRPATPS